MFLDLPLESNPRISIFQDIIAISCSWCKTAYHNKLQCFSMQRLEERCTLGTLGELILPPCWIVKTQKKVYSIIVYSVIHFKFVQNFMKRHIAIHVQCTCIAMNLELYDTCNSNAQFQFAQFSVAQFLSRFVCLLGSSHVLIKNRKD